MKEILDIVRAWEASAADGLPCALATIVGVTGSSYRRPGARMLFSPGGRLAGLINAACLEADLALRAADVIRGGRPVLVTYDSRDSRDIVLGLGLGCEGAVEILLEPGSHPVVRQKIQYLKTVATEGTPGALATVVRATGWQDAQVGDYVARASNGAMATTIRDSRLSAAIGADTASMGTTPFDRKKYSRGQEEADVFLEAILPPLRLIVFGAGPDAVPLVDTAKLLGWHVTVIDRRPAYASPPRLPCADEVLISEGLPPGLAITDRHAAVIMTHHYLTDRALLPALLESPARYVGLLGPREKRQRLLRDLQGAGFTPSRSQLDRLYAPVGLDIGAETPEEIALSVVAEIAAVVGGRSGGSLRRRPGRIHEVPG